MVSSSVESVVLLETGLAHALASWSETLGGRGSLLIKHLELLFFPGDLMGVVIDSTTDFVHTMNVSITSGVVLSEIKRALRTLVYQICEMVV